MKKIAPSAIIRISEERATNGIVLHVNMRAKRRVIEMPLSKYVYEKFMINRADDLIKALDQMGEKGWQVIQIEEMKSVHMSHKGIAKRRVL